MTSLNERARAVKVLHEMLRIRVFEDMAAEQYTAENIRGFLHLCVGEEAIAVGVMQVLGEQDNVVSTYREHGHAIARGMSMGSIMAEMYGKQEGCSRGRGGSMHLFSTALRFWGGNAIVAGGLPLAVGLALADRVLARPAVTACFFGDGATAEGEFFEALNLAALWKLPVLFLRENNLYAMGTAIGRYLAQPDLCRKASAQGVAAQSVDGMDVAAVEAAARAAVDGIRSDGLPRFLELKTYRFRAHSMFDAQLYRGKDEVDSWRERDPIATFAARLRERGWLDDDTWAGLEARATAEVGEAVAFAAAGAFEPIADLEHDVYTEGS